jgi:transcriptional regulator with XRE-family HTH domain
MNVLERRKKFGKWLRNCRKQARVTQAELAKALGYDSSQLISNIERGVSLLPSKRLPEFARVLGCSLLEMEVRYFQCSARNTSESRMPDLLLKYLPVIEVLEYGRGTNEEVLEVLRRSRQAHAAEAQANGAQHEATALGGDEGDDDSDKDTISA